MFISGISPDAGPDGPPTTVTITGQGFVAPVSVTVSGGDTGCTSWNVLSVAGTQIVVQAPAVTPGSAPVTRLP